MSRWRAHQSLNPSTRSQNPAPEPQPLDQELLHALRAGILAHGARTSAPRAGTPALGVGTKAPGAGTPFLRAGTPFLRAETPVVGTTTPGARTPTSGASPWVYCLRSWCQRRHIAHPSLKGPFSFAVSTTTDTIMQLDGAVSIGSELNDQEPLSKSKPEQEPEQVLQIVKGD